MSDALFFYTARNAEGTLVKGSIAAPDGTHALKSLRTRALYVTDLDDSRTARGTIAQMFDLRPVNRRALVGFFRSFATLLAAGVPLRRSLEVTIEAVSQRRLREALAALLADIESGLSLSAAMSRRPREFSRLFIAMIRAGELGGVLDEVLDRLASFLERDSALRARLGASLAYPGVVALTAAGLILFLLTSIVPMFQTMYDQMNVALPPITSLLIRLSGALRHPIAWMLTAAACAVVGGLYLRLKSTPAGAYALDGARMRLPIVGPLSRKTAVARFARMLGSLLRSGVGLVGSLNVVADVVGSPRYQKSVLLVCDALAEGEALATPLAASALYDPLFVQMVRVGEETGTLDSMLLRVADYYETDVEATLDALGSILEPIMIVVLGGAVGCIVAAVFIPLYTLIGNIK
ncbi:MAG: type II secretion system F family protein [Candidatus Eremiobacteraeota bacterium]|nr:type II secretion system F family protein [Candidatus Eremiobacteraeota bacterium]